MRSPVVDEKGEIMGVVSSTDVVRLAAEEDEEDPYDFFLPEDSPATGHRVLSQFPESALDTATVEDIMTPVSFTIEAGASVKDLSDFLVRGRIHRAVVVEEGRLVGIVTSNDVLRAVADGKLGPGTAASGSAS